MLKSIYTYGLIGSATIVRSTGNAVAGTFSTTIIAQLAFLEFAGVSTVALLLFPF
jgi:hypothetical protein